MGDVRAWSLSLHFQVIFWQGYVCLHPFREVDFSSVRGDGAYLSSGDE